MHTDVLPTTSTELHAHAIETAVTLLRNGEVVALPTETVYGLAADALKSEAVLKIFEAKGRPRFDPLIVHLPNLQWLERVAKVDRDAQQLVEKLSTQFWPGPLTMILPRQEIIPEIVTAGLNTVAVRISAHPTFSEVARQFDSPLAAPSANRFGRISPTAAQHVLDELDGRIPLIVDSGPTVHGIESTIVAIRNGRIELLRRGPITVDQLAPFCQVVVPQPTQHPEAPGQLPSHYAPSTRLVVAEAISAFSPSPNQRCGALVWSTDIDPVKFAMIKQLSSRQDLREAAANLFRCLRELDQSNLDLIVAEKLPDEGLGAAINDRLERAST